MDTQPNFGDAVRLNQAFQQVWGSQNSVNDFHWSATEGDLAALQRSAFPSQYAQDWFNGKQYNNFWMNMVTTGSKGMVETMNDTWKLFKGYDDFTPDVARANPDYGLVTLEKKGSFSQNEALLGVILILTASGFLMLA